MKTEVNSGNLLPRPKKAIELFNAFSLSLVAQRKYAALLYDKKGRPLWAANRHSHSFAMLLEEMLKTPFNELVQSKVSDDLNELFVNPKKGELFFPSTDPETSTWAKELLPGKTGLIFLSANKVERSVIANAAKIKTPLSTIWLFSLSSDLFLCILSLSELFSRLVEAGERMLLAMDVNGENRAFSDAMLARLESEFGNVNRIPIPRIIYEEDNLEDGGTETSLTTVIKWGINSQDKSLFDTMQTEINLENQAEALNFSNKNSERYGYLSMKDMGVYDNEDFDFTVALPPGTESRFPGIMLRADYRACNRDHIFPDNAGYNITQSADHLYWQIKKSGVVVAHFIGSNLSPFTQRKLTISKRGPAIKLFVNDKLIGRYNELHKWQKSQFKSVLLFLRPGQTSKISSLEYKRSSLSGIEQIGSRPIAEFPRKDTEPLRFSVVSRTVLSGPKAVEMVELIDLSILEKRIRNLEEERARIMSFIRTEHKPVSESPLFLKLLNDLPRVAQSELTVLIEGETGTGKEVMAKAIHDSSKRAVKPFVKIDCMTIPENLIESELFGHEKGAFTGANTARDGRIAQAEGGTLFLDEISNMPINVQMKLLSVLQDRKYHRLGGTGSRNANVRFIAASNKKLTDLIKAGLFREDLYYRLNQVIYVLPPLRERKVDIPLLSRYFLQEAAHINGIGTVTLAPSAVRALMNHSWPGNIRELRNTVIRSALFAENGVIDEKNIVFEIGERVDDFTTNSNRKRRYYTTKESLQELVNKYNGNISEVARKLGATRQTVYRFIKRFGIKLPSYL